MKVALYEDEWYPVFTMNTDIRGNHPDDIIDIDDEVVNEYKELLIQFNRMQKKLREIVKENNDK